MKKIGIVVAMAVESEPLQQVFGAPKKSFFYGAFDVKEYAFDGKSVYFATCTEGEIAAASCTQYLISTFGVELIFNYGLCGALDGGSLGETYLIKGVAHYEFDLSPLSGAPVGKYERFDGVIIPTDEKMRKAVKTVCPDIKEVVCASGDKFVADAAIKERLRSTYGASVCEMESAGVLITSVNAGVPQIIIKVVSDSGDDATEFIDYVKGKNTEYIDLVAKVLKSL